MPKPKHPKKPSAGPSVSESIDALVETSGSFDFKIDADDFVLYELNRLIEEDRASFEDEEFRTLIDEGIREHIEENLSVRSTLALALRAAAIPEPATLSVRNRVIRALEDTESELRNVAFVVRTYTAYLFERFQSIDSTLPGETESREMIATWKSGTIPNEKIIEDLQHLGRAALGSTADLLLNSPDSPQGRSDAEMALAVLSHIRSSVSARVLAFSVSEPMMDEDLEARAYSALRDFWPLARPYILHSLHSHAHEDLPFRWFQLLLEVDEVTSSELVYEEMRRHGDQLNYREDLWALTGLLIHSRDPEIEDKVLGWINAPQTPQPVVPMLQEFLKEYRQPGSKADMPDPWSERTRLQDVNRRYIAAAQQFDAERIEEARKALDEILKEEPDYPFAVMLKGLSNRCKT